MPLIRFNIFQRLIRTWETVHPYNAAQLLRIRGAADSTLVEDAWGSALSTLGLGRVSVSARGFAHESRNDELCRYPIRQLPPDTVLQAHLSDQLNRPFDDPAEPPFWPFLRQTDDGYWFGVVYRHWVADSVSIRLLLREWFVRCYDPQRRGAAPLRHPDAGYWRTLCGRGGGTRLDETALMLARHHLRFRRVLKPRPAGSPDYAVRVALRAAPEGMIELLRGRCRTANIRLSDLLLAALVEASRRHVPLQPRPRRRDVAVGNTVDLRPHARSDLSDVFGLFLGFTSVVCRPGEVACWPALLRAVELQTRAHRRANVARSSTGWMAAALTIGRLVPPHRLYHFYRKEVPLAAGLSNVTLNDAWAAAYHPDPLLDYVRISPTGPMAPLALSTTTLGARLQLALTYRSALLDDAGAEAFLQSYLNRLSRCAAGDV